MSGKSMVLPVCMAILLIATPATAHHSVWAEFDNKQAIELKGRFIEMEWINPHSWVQLEVRMEDGSTVIWSAETPPPNQMIRQGWRRNDIQPGDEILVRGFAARNGKKRVWAQKVSIIAQNGKELSEPRTVLALFEPKPEGVPEGLLPGKN